MSAQKFRNFIVTGRRWKKEIKEFCPTEVLSCGHYKITNNFCVSLHEWEREKIREGEGEREKRGGRILFLLEFI